MEKYILIQGAMKIEVEYLLSKMENRKEEIINGCLFCVGKLQGKNVIISLTNMGMLNASISTFIALLNYEISFVINQGIAGSHKDYIEIGDIVIASKVVNINSFVTPERDKGSDSLSWEFYKKINSDIDTDKKLINLTKKVELNGRKIHYGNIGSGDIFNREKDRIKFISYKKETLCEEMEGYGVYMVCRKLCVPCIGIRTISNNELLNQKLNEDVAVISQQFVLSMLEKF